MNFLRDIITYVRRIIKSPSDAVITDALIIDYINRFWIMDVDARIQLFDLKTKYQFVTTPGVDRYNMPLYSFQSESTNPDAQDIGFYPVYQGFLSPAYINGIAVTLQTQKSVFFNVFPNVTQYASPIAIGTGDSNTIYELTFPVSPGNSNPVTTPINALLRGHVDITGIIATGKNQDPPLRSSTDGLDTSIPVTSVDSAVYFTGIGTDGAPVIACDSGQFLVSNQNCGLLMTPGKAPYGNTALPGGYSETMNTINYLTGTANVKFPSAIAEGTNINAQCYFFQSGLPRGILFYDNVITLRVPPAMQYLVEMDAYLSPAAFFDSSASIPFAYMAEYIARGAARKILSDTGDVEQFQFYEPLFREQEMLVWKRAQRQFTSTRTETIYSQGFSQGTFNNFQGGTGAL